MFLGAINLIHVKVFGELEFWLSIVKVSAIVAMILGGLGLMFYGFHADHAGVVPGFKTYGSMKALCMPWHCRLGCMFICSGICFRWYRNYWYYSR